jgi:hypothetical protein
MISRLNNAGGTRRVGASSAVPNLNRSGQGETCSGMAHPERTHRDGDRPVSNPTCVNFLFRFSGPDRRNPDRPPGSRC